MSAGRPTSVLFLSLLATRLAAQGPAASYEDAFRNLWKLRPADRAATVDHLVLHRDRAELTLDAGTLYLMEPVGGRPMAAVFRGSGRLHYTPGTRMERERLRIFRKADEYDEPLDEAVLFFADSTLAELERQATFGPGTAPGDLAGRFRELLDYFGDEGDRALHPDLLDPVLNGEASGLFLVMVSNHANDPWMLLVDPAAVEGVQLLTRAKRTAATRRTEAVTMNRPEGDATPPGEYAERRPGAHVARYTLQVRLPQSTTGDLKFSAAGTLEIVADSSIGPWIPFVIYPEMTVDSASWTDGTPAAVVLAKDNPYVWVRAGHRLAAGEQVTLRLGYHGDLIERFRDWFYIKSSIAWYPVSLEGRYPAQFDLTFLSPEGFQLAAVGERTDSAAAPDHMIRTRWVTPAPIRNASFNVGVFESYRVPATEGPPVTILWSDDMHKAFTRGTGVLRGRNMKQQVGDDVVNALKFYEHVYGPAPVKQFYATEIPWLHGEAWPGIIGLSWVTFQQTDQRGADEVFRAHEVAHQWWGIKVDYATYHDRWLSEGLASFSGLWYLQTRRQANDKYFSLLDEWKASIMLRRDDPLPVWLGHRVVTANTTVDDYNAIVYEKGAWAFHMLRILLLDLPSMSEDRFTRAMQAFYAAHAGGRASTADLQQVFEQTTGQPMGWFFDEWVYGTGIPTYKVAWKPEQAGARWQVRLRVQQERVPPEFLMYVPVAITLENKQVARVRVKVTGATTELAIPVPGKPKEVQFNDLQGVLAEVKQVGW